MSLNNIALTSSLLVDLYANGLIEKPEKQKSESSLDFIGNNLKNILIVVDSNAPVLPEQNFNFLKSVLVACKLTIGDVAIVNKITTDTLHHEQLTSQFNSKIILLFNIDPLTLDLPFYFPPFQIQQFDGCVYLSAPSLTELQNDKNLKAKLWNSLKILFRI